MQMYIPVIINMENDFDNNVIEHGIEVVGVNPIPDKARNMSSSKIYIFWAMAGASALTPVIGEEFYNMGLMDLMIAITVAFLIGLIPAGLISEMGRQIPVPSLVVSRKTFGYMSSSVYSIIFTFLNIGFFGLNDTVGAEIISSLTHTNIILWYIIMGIIQIIIVLFGAKWLEYFFRYSAPVLLISYGILAYFLLTAYKINFSHIFYPIGPFSWGAALNFVLGFSILAWTYKISTQTRFGLPYSKTNTKSSRIKYFLSSPFGIITPLYLMGIIGLTGNSVNPGVGWNIAVLPYPGLHGIFYIIIFIAALGVSLAIIHTNAMNLYPATADLLASIQPLFGKSVNKKLAQPVATILLGIGGIILAMAGILAHISDFIDILASIIFPFTFILIFDWFIHLRYTTKINDYYKVPKNIFNNVRIDALIPAIIGTLIAIFGIGKYDFIFNYFPQALLGSLIGLLIYIGVYYAFVAKYTKDKYKKLNNYKDFDIK